jgi:DNA-binding XRE family transcriptional regulator
MIRAYDEIYLEGAMIRMGDMFEYACLDLGFDPDCFFKMFIRSGLARRFETGDVSVIAGKSGPELAFMILSATENKKSFPEPLWREDRSDIFWCGWVMAYYQWYSAKPYISIWKNVSIRTLQKMYNPLHEADISKTVEALDSLQTPPLKNSVSNLRLIRGLTQRELAERAHMSVSQIQRLEYGERKVENLSLKSALALAGALGVEVDEIA